MANFFLEHQPGCTPIQPCTSCRAMRFLEKKLPEADFATLVSIVLGDSVGTGSGRVIYNADNPAPLHAVIADIFPELPVWVNNPLKNDEIITIGDLVKQTERELLRTPNFGRRGINEIKKALASVGRHLADRPE